MLHSTQHKYIVSLIVDHITMGNTANAYTKVMKLPRMETKYKIADHIEE